MAATRRRTGSVADRFGRNIHAARAHARMTQKTLARRVGVGASYLSLIEAGKRTVDIELAGKFALALNVPLAVLLEAETPFTQEAP